MCFGNSASTDRGQMLNAYGTLDKTIPSLESAGRGLTSMGTSAAEKSLNYFGDLLSGNPARTAAAMAPEAAAAEKKRQQESKQIAEMGNRGGGTNEITANLGEATRGSLIGATAAERSKAAGAEGSLGTAMTGQGIQAQTAGGDLATRLLSEAGTARTQSQAMHNEAINNWANMLSDVLSGQGALSGLSTWGM